MPDHSLAPSTALGDATPRTARIGAVRLTERADVALASATARAGRAKTVHARVANLLGSAPDAGRLASGDAHLGFWIGPDQWMVLSDHARHENFAAELKVTLGDAASVTEQNDGWAIFDLEGDDLSAVLARLANIDAAGFTTGRATRIGVHHMGCFLLCLDTDRRYRVMTGRSFAGSFWRSLTAACETVRSLRELSEAND